jgi:indole-3-glycerol phosphate synthase
LHPETQLTLEMLTAEATPSFPVLGDIVVSSLVEAVTIERIQAMGADPLRLSVPFQSMAERTARAYAGNGAAALSVVVEPDFFFGSWELLSRLRQASGLPAIAKDFVVDVRQIDAARAAGADAILLIAALYDRPTLRAFAGHARALGLAPLVETHAGEDLELLAGDAWELVGVNHRDLATFEVDLGLGRRLLPRLPAGALKVAESGLRAASEIAALAADGFDAFLIGESLLLAPDPGAKLAELLA